MGICAVIVTFNTGSDVLTCINSIRNQVDEVIIVDNGSDVKTLRILKQLESEEHITVLYNRQNLGIATAFNIGIKHAQRSNFDWILLLDHDSFATTRMIETMMQAYNEFVSQNSNHKIGIVAPVPYDTNAGILLKKIRKEDKSSLHKAVISSGSLIPTQVFKDVGLLNEDLFLYYVDDDFCIRLRKAGYKILVANEARLMHAIGKMVSKKIIRKTIYYTQYNPLAYYYITRNGIYIIKKHALYDMRYLYLVPYRIVRDKMEILFFSSAKLKSLGYLFRGFIHGIAGKYGKLE